MTPVGGQAVLEGVMMRTPRFWAVSVRRPDGRISHVSHAATSVAARHRLLRLPFIRGIVALGDSLAIGFRALGLSAQWAASDDDTDEVTEELSTASIVVYVVIGKPDHWYLLVLSRVALLLPIAGVAYEVIRLAGKYGSNPVVRAALAPGLWLQRLTTRVPTLDQIEVSIDSLKTVLALEEEKGAAPQVEVMA